MQAIEIELVDPKTKKDCGDVNCNKCYKMFQYLMEDKPFICFIPQKSMPIWSGVYV